MMDDPIVDEIRKIRDAHAARFNYDLEAIYRDIKEREKEWEKKLGRKFISYAADRAEPTPAIPVAPVQANTTMPERTPATGH